MNCCICNNKIKITEFLSLGKASDGIICKSCKSFFPNVAVMKNYHSSSVKTIIDYEKEVSKEFSCTSRLGKLYLDEMNGLIAYGRGSKTEPKDKNIFKVSNIKTFDISVSEPIIKNRTIYCDILLNICLNNFEIRFCKPIKQGLRCEYQRVNAEQVKCIMPKEYTTIKAIVSQMFSNELTSILKEIKNLKEEKENLLLKNSEIDVLKAKSILLLNDGYTQEDVRTHYKQLARALHPDMNKNVKEDYAQKINWAYDILKDTK